MQLFEKCAKFGRARLLEEAGLYPYFFPFEGSDATTCTLDGKSKIMLGSNNYLGLTHDPRVVEAARDAILKYGTSCTGSRFLNGNLDLHEELEQSLAELVGKPAALVFSTGYQTNVGVISALAHRNDRVYLDRLDHASIVDGCLMAQVKFKRYGHNKLDELRGLLEADRENGHGTCGSMVVVDGVFSMEGDLCDLPGLVELCEQHGTALLLDDAHAIGVLGAGGAGTAEHFGLLERVPLILGTFSKSLASIGGFAAGSEEVIHFLRHNARSLMFSASIPPSAAAAALTALRIVREEPERRERLWRTTHRMRQGFADLGIETGPTESPIIPIYLGTEERTLAFWHALNEAGVYTNPILSPAVPEGSCLLRTSYMATHTDQQLEHVLEIFARIGRSLGTAP